LKLRDSTNLNESKKRRSIRLKEYDYSQPGAYFITICTQDKVCLFGAKHENKILLSESGKIAEKCWQQIAEHFPNVLLDAFVVMPNHVHGILLITVPDRFVGATHASPSSQPTGKADRATHESPLPRGPSAKSIGAIVGTYKATVSKQVHERNSRKDRLWQRSYYERVIRNDNELEKTREYIINNPLGWMTDREHPDNYQYGRHRLDTMPWEDEKERK